VKEAEANEQHKSNISALKAAAPKWKFEQINFVVGNRGSVVESELDVIVSILVCYVHAARDVVTVLLIFAKYLSLYLHIFICTYRGTRTQTHMYNQHTTGMATTRHRSLVERGGRKALVRDKGLAHTK